MKEKSLKEEIQDSVEELRKELAAIRSKLEEKEALFNSITESTLAGYWIWHILESKMFISPSFKGYARV